MANEITRFFRDERTPDTLISEGQLKREYGRHVADGSIDPLEKGFSEYLLGCMEAQGGTLSEVVIPEPKPKKKYPFMIRETLTLNVEIEADSFEDAQERIQEMYHEGEFDLDHNCFAGVEFRPQCAECESDFDEDADGLREVNEDTPLAMVICDRCVADMEDSGKLTRCECCGDLFAPSRLEINPENGMREICPLCGDVWCE